MNRRLAFTLVELLIVIAIIAVLLAIMMPSLTTVKAMSKRLQCGYKLSNVGRAMTLYTDHYEGTLPLLEYYNNKVPSIESTYLLSKTGSYRHLGCLVGAGLIEDGKVLFCPAVNGWLGEPQDIGTNNGTHRGAVHAKTGKFADLEASQPNQGWKATKGYCYWPLGKTMAKQADIDKMAASSKTRYNVGLPLNATKLNELMMSRPIVTDNKFHSTKTSGWLIDCLYPDGHVSFQKQPKKQGLNGYGEQGVWGMYSNNENCQFSGGVTATDPVTISDPQEKGLNLAAAVTPTEFAFALEP
jgi:prepilin-type N-terminal cleavage/methylation domain-containing protein